jgi:hypothetical protein
MDESEEVGQLVDRNTSKSPERLRSLVCLFESVIELEGRESKEGER